MAGALGGTYCIRQAWFEAPSPKVRQLIPATRVVPLARGLQRPGWTTFLYPFPLYPRHSRSLTAGRLWGSGQLTLSRVTAPSDDDWLLHHVDAVTLHQVLQQVKYLLCSGTLEGKDPCANRKRGVEKERATSFK